MRPLCTYHNETILMVKVAYIYRLPKMQMPCQIPQKVEILWNENSFLRKAICPLFYLKIYSPSGMPMFYNLTCYMPFGLFRPKKFKCMYKKNRRKNKNYRTTNRPSQSTCELTKQLFINACAPILISSIFLPKLYTHLVFGSLIECKT